MKALVYTAPRTLQLQELPPPSPEAGSVRVRVEAVGICGSDLHAWHGHDPRRVPPLVLGHEFAGTVLEGPLAGCRVTANPLVVCGQCRYCRQGRGNLCAHRRMIGMNIAGAFAEELSVPEQCLIELPPGLDACAAALAEPAATVLHAFALAARSLAQPLPQARVLVIGAGAIGLLAALHLQSHGGAAAAVLEANPLRRQRALQATGIEVRDPRQEPPAEAGADLVFDAVGSAATRTMALHAVAPGGTVVHVGLADGASEIDMRKLTLAEVTLAGSYTYTGADLRAAVRALAAGRFGDLSWVDERPLDEGPQAFADMAAGRVGAAKILLRPRREQGAGRS
ncbi:alcohol dehydrogenase catalytic domain-containing protein [Ramlibacter tataouinensis]|uniref:Threonine dehydrogenase and related Zn-dependent dehydrogenase-like protein n=1 Tax=Ramlibacter tataouinensis (strain ATCC BAA-407 / DSM 14655 / LMG 21543 / TTB310) TaxID=365046 RepID=F5Y4I6_RAMTT|nr:alcohol dehydrogenase catalytic domain-containing protein [Ramlibacter tataouinensis]AEG93833.1 threonine dehydrogenase and related Zn-dependent dehydrogenase-like protein [Ramlibacter tataouinensis TTB310]